MSNLQRILMHLFSEPELSPRRAAPAGLSPEAAREYEVRERQCRQHEILGRAINPAIG